IAHRRDGFAVRNVSLDACWRLRMEKIRRRDFCDGTAAGRVAKVMRVPVDALVVERTEKLRLLDAVGHVHRVAQRVVEPGRTSARRPDSDNVGEPHLPYFI